MGQAHVARRLRKFARVLGIGLVVLLALVLAAVALGLLEEYGTELYGAVLERLLAVVPDWVWTWEFWVADIGAFLIFGWVASALGSSVAAKAATGLMWAATVPIFLVVILVVIAAFWPFWLFMAGLFVWAVASIGSSELRFRLGLPSYPDARSKELVEELARTSTFAHRVRFPRRKIPPGSETIRSDELARSLRPLLGEAEDEIHAETIAYFAGLGVSDQAQVIDAYTRAYERVLPPTSVTCVT
jgi:hypothetical protein